MYIIHMKLEVIKVSFTVKGVGIESPRSSSCWLGRASHHQLEERGYLNVYEMTVSLQVSLSGHWRPKGSHESLSCVIASEPAGSPGVHTAWQC